MRPPTRRRSWPVRRRPTRRRPAPTSSPSWRRSGARGSDPDLVMPLKTAPIGARARRFVLEMPVETPDGFGGVLRSFAPGPQLWGAIEMLSGGERHAAGRPEQAVTHRVRLRYRAGVTAAMRLTPGTPRLAIRAPPD